MFDLVYLVALQFFVDVQVLTCFIEMIIIVITIIVIIMITKTTKMITIKKGLN